MQRVDIEEVDNDTRSLFRPNNARRCVTVKRKLWQFVVMSMAVCLSVCLCLFAHITRQPHNTAELLQNFLHVACGRDSVLL